MTVAISVEADVRQALKQLRRTQRVVIPKATVRALNRTATQVRTAATKDLARTTGLRQKDVRQKLTLFKAKRYRLEAVVQATGRALNLIRFGARQTKKGVTAKAWGKRRLYRGTFIANQGRTVFKRARRGGRRVGRLPIEAVHGPSIPREFVRERVTKAMRQVVATRWPVNFRQDLRYYLSRLR